MKTSIVGVIASAWLLWAEAKQRPAKLSEADTLGIAAGWFLAVMLCALLMNWTAFQTGFNAAWNAAAR